MSEKSVVALGVTLLLALLLDILILSQAAYQLAFTVGAFLYLSGTLLTVLCICVVVYAVNIDSQPEKQIKLFFAALSASAMVFHVVGLSVFTAMHPFAFEYAGSYCALVSVIFHVSALGIASFSELSKTSQAKNTASLMSEKSIVALGVTLLLTVLFDILALFLPWMQFYDLGRFYAIGVFILDVSTTAGILYSVSMWVTILCIGASVCVVSSDSTREKQIVKLGCAGASGCAILCRIIGLCAVTAPVWDGANERLGWRKRTFPPVAFYKHDAGFYCALTALLLHVGSVGIASYRELNKKSQATDKKSQATDSSATDFQV